MLTEPVAEGMQDILGYPLAANEAAFWFLGQSGYVIRSSDISVVIDPYLSDSAGHLFAECCRVTPIPLPPRTLKVDVFVVTHNHLDHLDPETIIPYEHKHSTIFVGPRLVCERLREIGVPPASIRCVDAGVELELPGLTVRGIFALPTGADVIDTTGYLLQFANGRTVYHTSDTAFDKLVAQAAPRRVDVMLVPINGKWRNLNADEAVELAEAVDPSFVVPNHYDVMSINSENPCTMAFLMRLRKVEFKCVIAPVLQPFVWSRAAR